MKIFTRLTLTLALLFGVLGGVNSVKAIPAVDGIGSKVYGVDYSTLEDLPNWHNENCARAITGGHLTVQRNAGITNSWGSQIMVGSGIPTTIGNKYLLKFRIKGTEAGSVTCLFGGWGDGNAENLGSLNITTEWQDVEILNSSAIVVDSWIVLWVGAYAGTISLEKVDVYNWVIEQRIAGPKVYTFTYTNGNSWYHGDNWGCAQPVSSDGVLSVTNDEVKGDASNVMYFVGDNISTTEGKEYIVRATMKGSSAGSIRCNLGTWDKSGESSLDFSNSYQEVETLISGLSTANNNHVLFKIGKYVGTVDLKKIEVFEAVAGRTVTVGSAGYTTYAPDKAVDVDGVVNAYTAKYEGGKVVLTSVTQIPAGAGVIIEATAGDYDVPLIESASALSENELQVSDGTVTGASGDIYVLYNGEHGVGFYLVDDGVTIPAGKAYLQIAAAGRSFLGFSDEATAISNVKAETADDAIYNVAGQRVTKTQKGLYIVNGKKMLVK